MAKLKIVMFALCISCAAFSLPAFAQAPYQPDASEGKPPLEKGEQVVWDQVVSSHNDQNIDLWAEFRNVKISDRDGICVLGNPFDHLDPEGFKKHGVNCWFPVFEQKSLYYIKIFEFSRTTGGVFFSKEGWTSRPPVEVWVKGVHSADPTVRYRKSLALYRLTCLGGVARFARLKFLAYDASGKVVEDWEKSTTLMRVAPPGSKEEAFAFFVCKG